MDLTSPFKNTDFPSGTKLLISSHREDRSCSDADDLAFGPITACRCVMIISFALALFSLTSFLCLDIVARHTYSIRNPSSTDHMSLRVFLPHTCRPRLWTNKALPVRPNECGLTSGFEDMNLSKARKLHPPIYLLPSTNIISYLLISQRTLQPSSEFASIGWVAQLKQRWLRRTKPRFRGTASCLAALSLQRQR